MINKPITILLVDDKDWTRYTVSRLLQSERYVVREAPTGADALRLAAQKPDLIILDIKLPDLDGYEVCRRIKADPATASIPVLHLSATFVESDSRSTGLEGGADGYLTYPVEARELVAHVEALLRTRKAERAARDQEELLRVTLSSIADAVIATDVRGDVTFLNPVAQELCGWSAEEAIGAPLARVFHIVDEQTREVMEDPVSRVVREERAVRLPGRTLLIAKDLVERPIEDNGAPIRDEEGNLRGVVLVFRDVTQRRAGEEALRRAEERLRLMVDSVQDYAIFTLDPSGRVSSWGTGAERVFGYPESEIVGQSGNILWIEEDRLSGMPKKELLTAGTMGRAEDERWHQRKDGSRFFASGVVTPIRGPSGELHGFTKVARDVTARKLSEEALKEADQRKDEFLAMLAHELRNPLAPISNSLSLIRHHKERAHEDVREAAEMMQRQVEHMIRLVDDLLDVSRITRGLIHLQRETVDLATVLNRAVESSRPIIDARGHELEIHLPDESLYVDADPVRLAQVFWNLLNNAAKYTPQGGRITVRVETAISPASPSPEALENRSKTEELVIRITDTGIGIPSKMLPEVFELFTQVERTFDRAEGGLGIGLTLVRRLVEMHGGRVEARSAGPGSGSEFEVRLPLVRRGAQAPPSIAQAAARPDSGTALRILIVDDNRDSAESLASLLRIHGNDVCTAYEGRQALAVAEEYRPEVILLDLGLPGINGFEVAKQMRLSPVLTGATIVAITGFGTENDRRLSKDAGFDHHLVKPVDFTTLSQLLARHSKCGA